MCVFLKLIKLKKNLNKSKTFFYFRIELNCRGKRLNPMVVHQSRNMSLKNAKKEKDPGKK